MTDMGDETEFVTIPQSYPIWALRFPAGSKESTPEPVIAWRIAVGDPTQRPIPICPMRGALNPDEIGEYVTTPDIARRFEESVTDMLTD